MFNLFPQKKSVDEILEDSKPKINITAEWNELLKEVLQLRPLKEENTELIVRLQIVQNDYKKCTEQRDEYKHQLNAANKEIEKLKKDIVDYVFEKDDKINNLQKELNHMKAVAEGAISLCDLSDKTDYDLYKAQKHPMYPLHWMGLDPLIHEQAKDLTIEETIDKVRKKTPWVEEPINWGGYDGAASAYPEQYSKWLNEQKDKTTVKLEESWEEAASDLALRVVKLEKQIKELTLIKLCQKPS